jgi:hypothetical protein
VSQRQTPLGHHLHQIAQAELVAQVPAHAKNDYIALKVNVLRTDPPCS